MSIKWRLWTSSGPMRRKLFPDDSGVAETLRLKYQNIIDYLTKSDLTKKESVCWPNVCPRSLLSAVSSDATCPRFPVTGKMGFYKVTYC